MVLKFYYFLIFFLLLFLVDSKRLLNKQKKRINLAFTVTNNYINFLYISLVSLLENSDKNSIYNIYIQVGQTFESINENLLFKLEKIYLNCFINIINMKTDFSQALKGILDISAYYRLKLPILCPSINRIIHIDSDTIILKDLMELYTLNFEEKYILGRLDILVNELDNLNIKTNTYINSGVLLFDLYSLRKYNYTSKFLEYLRIHNYDYSYLNHHDQTLINYVCYDKIGILRPKYHMWPFNNEKEVVSTNKIFRIPYNEKEFINDFYDPFIVHYPGNKKKDIYSKGGRFYDIYYEYSNLAEQKRTNSSRYNIFKILINWIVHFFNKIVYKFKKKNPH